MTGRTRKAGGGRRPARPAKPTVTEVMEVVVTGLGAQGDGLANAPSGLLYIPLTVPGDRLIARTVTPRGDGFAAELIELLDAGPTRAPPPCAHFGHCGGCSLQHLNEDAYTRWKTDRLTVALARTRLQSEAIDPLWRTPPGSRRRATLAVVRPAAAESALVGFQMRRGHQVVDLVECPVLRSSIVAVLPAFRAWMARILAPGQRTELMVFDSSVGLDVVLTLAQPPDLALRETLVDFARSADLARLSLRFEGAPAEPVVTQRPVQVRLGSTTVPLPPGGFLQPSEEGEVALAAAVIAAVGGDARTVADLFAGVGTFSARLAEAGMHVHAVDADGPAIAALAAAGVSRIRCEQRDLFARPLRADELRRCDALVFDPPRAGARAQAEQLAQSSVPIVVAVSCNPDSFVRDARILVDGGYRLLRITPVDQFLWSPHLELVAVFRRADS